MNRLALLFPGQGSQRVGMGNSLLERYSTIVQPIFDIADDILGYPISRLCREGSEEELRSTDVTQPAIFTMSIATLKVLEHHGVEAAMTAGHSLGEYAALVAAGVLDWREALPLVQLRGQLMFEVNTHTPGTMIATMQVPLETVELWCVRASEETSGVLEVANDNGAGQIVVAGNLDAAARFNDFFKDADLAGSRTVKLGVGAPFHCSLMASIEDQFASELANLTFAAPRLLTVANSTGEPVRSGAEAARALRAQIAGTVRWRESLELLASSGADAFLEVGPGKVLTGISRRSHPDIPSFNSSDPRFIQQAIEKLVDAVPAATGK